MKCLQSPSDKKTKVRQKNLTFEVFLNKLTYEENVQIYELRKQGQSFKLL